MEQKMDKSGLSFQLNSKHSALNKLQNKQRLLKIQQKLSAISQRKQIHIKDQQQEEITKRITELQLKSTQQIKQMETIVRIMREELGQVKLKEAEFIKKIQLGRKTRSIEIAQIREQIASLVMFQAKNRNEAESNFSRAIEKKSDSLLKELRESKQSRIQDINNLQETLESKLPQAQLDVRQSCEVVHTNLQLLHKRIRDEAAELREETQRKQVQKDKVVKSIMQMISRTVEEIKTNLDKEKVDRERSKQQLIALFHSAYAKIKPFQ